MRTMLKKLCAVSLLVLALSPFTAPFQTCDFGDSLGGSTGDDALVLAQASDSDGAGTVVPPLTTETGRLGLAPVPGISTVVAAPPIVFLRRPIASSSRISECSVLLSVLRL
jgi:hypothetical protein